MIRIALTPDQYAAKQKQLFDEHQIQLTGNSGTETADGYTVKYEYDGTSTLTVTCLKTPRFMPISTSFAEHKIEGWLHDPAPAAA